MECNSTGLWACLARSRAYAEWKLVCVVLCREGKGREGEGGEILGCSGHWSEAAEESVCGRLCRGI